MNKMTADALFELEDIIATAGGKWPMSHTRMNDGNIELKAELAKVSSDEERVTILDKEIEAQQVGIFAMRCDLALAEGRLEGLMRLRKSIGAPKLSPKHTLRARIQKYLETTPGAGTSQIASGLCAPVITVSMCLGRNKNLFVQSPGEGWRNKLP